jgi:D-serine deaminase-like pyridoxal phosphate-dependent protein
VNQGPNWRILNPETLSNISLETRVSRSELSRQWVPTPALVIDMAVLERNIAAMAGFAATSGIHLRPHAKSHKCVAIARRQITAGAVGISCATLDEIAAMVIGEVPGLLLTSPIAGTPKLTQLGQLLRRDPNIMVVADDPAGVAELAALSMEVGARIRVLVDIDVGQQRTGCRTAAAAVALAQQINGTPGLEFCGVQAYAGHIQHIVAHGERSSAATAVAEQIRTLCVALKAAQLAPRIVTGAGTGTAEIDVTQGVYTELQPGSYVFMDVDYLRVEGVSTDYQPSLFVDATVVSVQGDGHVTTDAGTKAFALNGPAPLPATRERGWTYSYDGDEFGRITLAPYSRRPTRGERLALIVSHCDPTVVLYPQYVCVRGDRVEGCWPIEARR